MTTDVETPDPVEELAAACKALGEPRRWRVLRILMEVPDTLCGCELSDILDVPDYQVSRDLAALRRVGLVRNRGRSGTWVHYEANRQAPEHLAGILELVGNTPMGPGDAQRLELRYGLREQVGCVLGPGHPDVLATFDAAGIDTHRST